MKVESVDWRYTLYFKAILDYLRWYESIELSMSCKSLRSNTYPTLVKSFHFNEFFNNGNYKPFRVKDNEISYINPYRRLNINDEKSIDRFTLDLQAVTHPVKNLTIFGQTDYYYSYKLIDNFKHITNLRLSFCKITFVLLQYMLDNLKLTKLSVKIICVIIDNPVFCTNLPQSLVKFEYTTCYYKHVRRKFGNIKVQKQYHHTLPKFLFNPQHISSLKYLNYKSLSRVSNNFNQFLTLNPQLISVSACTDILRQGNLQIIQQNSNLENLEINNYYDANLIQFDTYLFNNLNTLKLVEYHPILYSQNFINFFPNLTKLEITFKTFNFVNRILFSAHKLKKLKFLTLKLSKLDDHYKILKFTTLKNLEVIEFYQYKPGMIEFNQLALFSKLYKIKVNGTYSITKCNPFISKVETIGNWKAVHYPESIIYYEA